jgi:hypothetical protein
MESLMDYDGPWSLDLINLMIPMAEQAELDEQERMMGAIGSVFGKDGVKEHRKRADKLRASIRARQLEARGIHPKSGDQAERDFRALEEGLFGAISSAKKGRSR